MFAALFGSRTPRSSQREVSFRPQLECLEDRLAPSGAGDPHGGGGPPDHNNQHINNHTNYNVHINNSFNQAIDNINVNGFLSTMAIPQAQLQQQFILAFSQAAQVNVSQAISLVSDEFHLALDTSSVVSSIMAGSFTGLNNSGLTQDITNLQLSIQSNGLEGTSAGETLGYLSFDLALSMTLSNQLGGTGHS